MTPFFAGFTAELVKTAAGHPLFKPVTESGRGLKRKVKKVVKKAGEGAQSTPWQYGAGGKRKKKMKKKAGEGAQSMPPGFGNKDWRGGGSAMPMPAGPKPQPMPAGMPGAKPKPQPMPAGGGGAVPMSKGAEDESSDAEAAAENLRKLIEDAQNQLPLAGEEAPMSGAEFGTGRPKKKASAQDLVRR